MTTIDLKRARDYADKIEYREAEAASLIRSLCEIVERLPKDVIDNLPIHGTIQHASSDQHNRE